MYYTIHKFSKLCGVTPQTLRNWDKAGKLKPHHTAPNGYRYYSQSQLDSVLGRHAVERIVIGYCRVSSKKQSDDLQQQVDAVTAYLTAQGQPFEIITDVGSGINYNKPGLTKLIEKINANQVSKVVVLYKDRLVRFGWDLLQKVADLHDTKLEIIDSTPKLAQQELVEDLVQIITVFSCKLQGQRANKAKQFAKDFVRVSSNENI